MTFYCYCIQTNNNKSYIGATNNFQKRIKQHNGLLYGGAKSTKGYFWTPFIVIKGFENRSELLSFEWHWKHIHTSTKKKLLFRRIHMLNKLLEKNKN